MPLQRDIAEAVVQAFRLGRLTGPVLAVARGAMGEISRVDTDTGAYAVKELFAWNPGTGVEQEVAFTAQARGARLRIPLEMRSGPGDLVVHAGSRRFRAYEWYDVGPGLSPPVDTATAGHVGRITATLHGMAEKSSEQVDPWYTTPPAASRWQVVIGRGADQRAEWTTALEAALLTLTALTALARDTTRGPFHVCHRDLDPSNVLPLQDGDLTVLDWENLGPLEPEQEIGYLLLSWCTDGVAVDPSAVRAFMAGYRGVTEQPWVLRKSSFATAAASSLNFLAAQAEASVDETQDAEHRAFGGRCVHAMLAAPMSLNLIDEVLAAAD